MSSKRSVDKAIKQADGTIFDILKKGVESAKEIVVSNACSQALFNDVKKLKIVDSFNDNYKKTIDKSDGIITAAQRICYEKDNNRIASMLKVQDASNSFFSKAFDASSDMLEKGNCSDENVKTVSDAIETMESMEVEGWRMKGNQEHGMLKLAENACKIKKEK